jgi:uncharacterized membrane protein YkvA (DUF1232 family)
MGSVLEDWWTIPVTIVAALAVVWLALAITLWLAKPDDVRLQDTLRLLPDVLRMLKSLATDRAAPRRVRVGLVLLLAFIASPIDLIPDFIPVIGFADDVVIAVLVLRWVTRAAGPDALAKHWPGTAEGLTALRRLCGLPAPE